MWAVGSRAKKEEATVEAGKENAQLCSQRRCWPESGSHNSDGFLWPEAVAEISFLPPHGSDVPPPRLFPGKARRPAVAVSQAAIQEVPFIAIGALGCTACGVASPHVGNKDKWAQETTAYSSDFSTFSIS